MESLIMLLAELIPFVSAVGYWVCAASLVLFVAGFIGMCDAISHMTKYPDYSAYVRSCFIWTAVMILGLFMLCISRHV